MNTGGPAFPIHGTGMFHEPITNTQGMTLLDWMAGQALAGLYGAANEQSYKLSREGHPSLKREDVAKDCYSMASAMLAEKARREADHSGDANKTVPSKSALIRAGRDLFTWADKTMDQTDECRVFLHNWREAVRCQPEDNSPDVGKMAALEAANRELVEALEKFLEAGVGFSTHPVVQHDAVVMALAALAKAKGVA